MERYGHVILFGGPEFSKFSSGQNWWSWSEAFLTELLTVVRMFLVNWPLGEVIVTIVNKSPV